MNTETPSILVALAGGSGSGKRSLALRLGREFGSEATLLSLEDFYRDLSHLRLCERERIKFDHPDSIDLVIQQPIIESDLSKMVATIRAMAVAPSLTLSEVGGSRITTRELLSLQAL